jgi:hypothetical protein
MDKIEWGQHLRASLVAANVFAVNSGLTSMGVELVLYFILRQWGATLVGSHFGSKGELLMMESSLLRTILKGSRGGEFYSDHLVEAIHSSLDHHNRIDFGRFVTNLLNKI